jgi:hypothetical protein
MSEPLDAIIIGAGPAGLATAAALRVRGLNASILEKSDAVGAVWRRHYDRLHLLSDPRRNTLASQRGIVGCVAGAWLRSGPRGSVRDAPPLARATRTALS